MPETETKKEYPPVFYDAPESIGRSVTAPEWRVYMTSMRETDRCANDLQAAIIKNYKGENISADLDALCDKYGKERVDYTLATFIKTRCKDFPEISEKTRAWANSVRISDSYAVAVMVIINGPRDTLNAYCEEISERDKAARGEPVRICDDPELKGKRVWSVFKSGAFVMTLPREAFIETPEGDAGIRLPDERTCLMPKTEIHESEEDGKPVLHVRLWPENELTVTGRHGTASVPVKEIIKALNNAEDEDFLVQQKYDVDVPRKAVVSETPAGVRLRMPDGSEYAGGFVTLAEKFGDFGRNTDDKIAFSLPENATLSVRMRGETKVISAETFQNVMDKAEYREHKRWTTFILPKEAFIKEYPERGCTLLKLPYDGKHDDCAFYLASGMVDASKAESDGVIKLTLPEDKKEIDIKNLNGQKTSVSLEDFGKIIKDVPGSAYRKPRVIDGKQKAKNEGPVR